MAKLAFVLWLFWGVTGCAPRDFWTSAERDDFRILESSIDEMADAQQSQEDGQDLSLAPLEVSRVSPVVASDAVYLDQALMIELNRVPLQFEQNQIRRSWLQEEQTDDTLALAVTVQENWISMRAVLKPDTRYTWMYPEGLFDSEIYWFFRTAWAGESEPARLRLSRPVAGEVAVSPVAALELAFNRPVEIDDFVLLCESQAIKCRAQPSRSGAKWTLHPETPLPGQKDCILQSEDRGVSLPFRTRIQIGHVALLSLSVDPQSDWSCSAGNCLPFTGEPGSGTVSTSDEYIVLINGSPRTIDLSDWALHYDDGSPEIWTLGDVVDPVFDDGISTLNRFRPGAIVVLGNPPGSMNNTGSLFLFDDTGQMIDSLEISDGPYWSDMYSLQRPGGGNAVGLEDEALRRFWDSESGSGYWKAVTAEPGRW